jgi:hypothetical protein
MNGEWILEILKVVIPSSISLLLGYYLGLRSQKTQTIREHVLDVSKDTYPELFFEIKRNSETLNSFLNNPNVSFHFPVLDDLYNRGLDEFVKTHHNNLFLMISSYKENIVPKLYELESLFGKLRDKLYDISTAHIRKSLPIEDGWVDKSREISHDLFKSINPDYIIPDLLSDRAEEARKKIEHCVIERTRGIIGTKSNVEGMLESLKPESKTKYKIEIMKKQVVNSLFEEIKPESKTLVDTCKELKKQNDEELEKILPLLQRYISNPI